MSLDHADILWHHMRKQAEADIPDEDQDDPDPTPLAEIVGRVRCLRCGAISTDDQCRECGFCIGCEGGCAA
jgi:hypothetical protein